jgi:TetR/AcrR family tetracycline transcriptional repressor
LQTPKRRKPRADGVPPLSRQRILLAALAFIDREGLAALSMRRLGAELGVEAMSLYRYFRTKDALFDGLVDVILAEMIMPPASEYWEEELTALAQAYRQAISAHPAALPVIATRPFQTPATLAMVERALDVLARSGWTGLPGLALLNTLSGFIVGYALMEVGPTPGSSRPTHPVPTPAVYTALSAQEFPHLAALMAEGGSSFDLESAFTLGLQTFIKGLQRSSGDNVAH